MSKIYRELLTAYARAWVRFKGNLAIKTWVLWEIILPTIFMASVIYAYKNLNAPPIFIGFVVLGTVMMNFWYNVLWGMGDVLYWDKETGKMEAFLITGRSIYMLLMGMALGGMINTGLRSATLLLIGIYIFGAEFRLEAVPNATLIFLLTLASLYCMGIIFSSLHLVYGRKGIKMNEVMGIPISFLSGQFYPINVFPTAVQMVASLLPLTVGLDGVRRALIEGWGIWELSPHIILLTIMTIVFLQIGVRFMNRIIEMGRRDGRLILRWQ